MIDVNYTLHNEDGDLRHEERRSENVPRVGELVTFDFHHSYQVVDVLWHLEGVDGHHVTVTACELGWHKHIAEVVTEWRNARR